MIHNKILLIRPGCLLSSIALTVQNRGLKQQSLIFHNLLQFISCQTCHQASAVKLQNVLHLYVYTMWKSDAANKMGCSKQSLFSLFLSLFLSLILSLSLSLSLSDSLSFSLSLPLCLSLSLSLSLSVSLSLTIYLLNFIHSFLLQVTTLQ